MLSLAQFRTLAIDVHDRDNRQIEEAEALRNEVVKYVPCEVWISTTVNHSDGKIGFGGAHVMLDLDRNIEVVLRNFNRKRSYLIFTHDYSRMKFVTPNDVREIMSKLTEPNAIGVLTRNKIKAHLEYQHAIYEACQELSVSRILEVDAFLETIENCGLAVRKVYSQYGPDRAGEIIHNGLEYSYEIRDNGWIKQDTKVHYNVPKGLESFMLLTDNSYTGIPS